MTLRLFRDRLRLSYFIGNTPAGDISGFLDLTLPDMQTETASELQSQQKKVLPRLRSFLYKHETLIVVILCILAGLRIFVFSAAFPFFNNVDERSHFDLVYKYSQGHIPSHLEPPSHGATEKIVFYASPEYLMKPEAFDTGYYPPPLWTFPYDEIAPYYEQAVKNTTNFVNHEATQPPVYYALAGYWYRLGDLLHITGGNHLYWVRFLNVPVFMLMVWLCHVFMRVSYPESGMMRLGGPLMLSFFPQDVFFSINNDIAASLLFGVAFLLLVKLSLSDSRSYFLYAFSGLVTSVAFWAKFSNIAVLFVAGIILLIKGCKAARTGNIRKETRQLLLFLICIVLPITLVLVRNYYVMGDFTGSSEKVRLLGWSMKPLSQMWNHPIFTPAGMYFFLSETLRNFWRGEFFWHGSILSISAVDVFYVVSSFVFALVSMISLLRSRKDGLKNARLVQVLSFFTVILSIGFLASVSILFDFGSCFYPSRQSPYLVSGRLMAGALIPFIAIYLDGLRKIFPGERLTVVRVSALLIICAVMVGSEIILTRDVFASQYNWYHIPASIGYRI